VLYNNGSVRSDGLRLSAIQDPAALRTWNGSIGAARSSRRPRSQDLPALLRVVVRLPAREFAQERSWCSFPCVGALSYTGPARGPAEKGKTVMIGNLVQNSSPRARMDIRIGRVARSDEIVVLACMLVLRRGEESL